jgi:hypothetical protein
MPVPFAFPFPLSGTFPAGPAVFPAAVTAPQVSSTSTTAAVILPAHRHVPPPPRVQNSAAGVLPFTRYAVSGGLSLFSAPPSAARPTLGPQPRGQVLSPPALLRARQQAREFMDPLSLYSPIPRRLVMEETPAARPNPFAPEVGTGTHPAAERNHEFLPRRSELPLSPRDTPHTQLPFRPGAADVGKHPRNSAQGAASGWTRPGGSAATGGDVPQFPGFDVSDFADCNDSTVPLSGSSIFPGFVPSVVSRSAVPSSEFVNFVENLNPFAHGGAQQRGGNMRSPPPPVVYPPSRPPSASLFVRSRRFRQHAASAYEN